MLRVAVDENFDNRILRGLLRRRPDVDVIRVQDTSLAGADDPTVLAWAAMEGRVLLTHDVTTLTKYAIDRTASGLTMPGLVEVGQHLPIGRSIDDLLLLIECSRPGEWEGRILFLPL